MCPLFLSLFTLVWRNLSVLLTFIFIAYLLFKDTWSRYEGEFLKWSWLHDYVVCTFCPLNLHKILMSILSQLCLIRSGKSGPAMDHDVRWVRVLTESAVWKQTSLWVELRAGPHYRLRPSVGTSIKQSIRLNFFIVPWLSCLHIICSDDHLIYCFSCYIAGFDEFVLFL